MQDPEQVRRFTRAVAMMRDPPLLPMAAWFAVVPILVQSGVIARPWATFWFVVAALASALASRWFRRTYGVVSPSPDTYFTLSRMGVGFGVVIGVLGLTLLAAAIRVPVELGIAAFGLWLAWAAHASKGLRPHLYVLAAVCIGLAFLPLMPSLIAAQSLRIFSTVFGVGWAYVCIQDYRVIRRSLRDVQS